MRGGISDEARMTYTKIEPHLAHPVHHTTIMLIRRIFVVFLVLLMVTTGYHIAKKVTTWKWSNAHLSCPPIPLVPSEDITVMYAFGPIPPKPAVKFGYYRPLQHVVSRRRHRN